MKIVIACACACMLVACASHKELVTENCTYLDRSGCGELINQQRI
jgi:hypothetical protein